MRLKEKVPLITGAGRGIGKEKAKTFAAEGVRMSSQYRNMTSEQKEADNTGQLVRKECYMFNLEDFDLKKFS